ncbi:hypothetical protein PVT71_01600 [Salipiger sp. H15]|uniref:DUF1127 domain-containing protein n=1 Tax=Alloyangia sp. H15 TaxID=3029062 RepID=A0AAU8AG66_9RHOB
MVQYIALPKSLGTRPRRKPFWLWLKDFLIREDRKHREALRFDALDNAARRDMGLPPKIEQARLPRGMW